MDTREILKTPGVVGKIHDATGINKNTIVYWGRRNRIPAEHVLGVSAATGIPRHELRPDIFPAEQTAE